MDIETFLISCQLQSYLKEFKRLGFDSVTQILEMNAVDLDESISLVGLNAMPGHQMRFKAKVRIEISKNKDRDGSLGNTAVHSQKAPEISRQDSKVTGRLEFSVQGSSFPLKFK